MGGLEPPTPGSRSRCAAIAPHPGGTDGRIRTDTDGVLSAVPLPLGYVSKVVAGAGIEPADRGVWAVADPRSPAVVWSAVGCPRTEEASILGRPNGLAGTIRTCDPAFGGRCSDPLSYGELAWCCRVDGRSRTCNLRLRTPAPCPLGHVDETRVPVRAMAPSTGIEPATSHSTGGRSDQLSYDSISARPGSRTQSVPGQEPGALPVRRDAHWWAGRESNPLLSDDAWRTTRAVSGGVGEVQGKPGRSLARRPTKAGRGPLVRRTTPRGASSGCPERAERRLARHKAPWRERPVRGQMALAPIDASSVVKVLVPDGCRAIREVDRRTVDDIASQARKESNPLPTVLETVAPPWLGPRCMDGWIPRVTGRAGGGRGWRSPELTEVRRWWSGRCRLPAHDGQAELGWLPSIPIDPRASRLIRWARRRAEARQG